MKHKYKDVGDSRREFIVEISSEEVKERLDGIYDHMRKTADMPGFRKGKIPRDILEKYHGDTARERALTDIVNDSYRRAVKESSTRVVGLPHISDIEFNEGKDVSYKAIVDVRPKIDLKDYKKIKVKKRPVEIKDEDLERYLSALQESYAQFDNVEDRPAKLENYLICDIICEVDGKPIHQEQKNIWFLLNKDHSIPELVDGLVGSSKGDTKEIKTTLPENVKDARYSKKEALFKVKVNEIKEKRLPEINDEFVKGLGTYQNVAEFKEAAEKDLIRKKENYIRQDMSNQIFEYLLKNSHFSAPKGLIDEETDRLVKDAKEDLRKKSVDKDEIEKKDEELRNTLRREAVKKVRLYFLLDEIAKIENIDVSDQEIDEMLNLLAYQSNTPKEEFKKHYKDNDLIPLLRNQLKENKVTEFLLNNAEVKEIGKTSI